MMMLATILPCVSVQWRPRYLKFLKCTHLRYWRAYCCPQKDVTMHIRHTNTLNLEDENFTAYAGQLNMLIKAL